MLTQEIKKTLRINTISDIIKTEQGLTQSEITTLKELIGNVMVGFTSPDEARDITEDILFTVYQRNQ